MTSVASIKGRIAELGPSLQHAPAGYVYVGRVNKRGKNTGGWDLNQSDFRNPYSVGRHGIEGAVDKFRAHFLSSPDLAERACDEFVNATLCCFCTDLRWCHTTVIAGFVNGHHMLAPGSRAEAAERLLGVDTRWRPGCRRAAVEGR